MSKQINKYEGIDICNNIRDKCIEEWRDVKGCPNHMVSNWGNIKYLNTKSNNYIILILSTTIKGYKRIGLDIYGIHKLIEVHRLVYQAFNDDLINELVIDHNDYNPSNNYYKNLQQITKRENTGKDTWRRKNITSKYVGVSWNKQTNSWQSTISFGKVAFHIGYFGNEVDASNAYKDILVNGKSIKYRKGRIRDITLNTQAQHKVMKSIIQYDLDNNEVDRFKSINGAAIKLSVSGGSISQSCIKNTVVNKRWRFNYE